MLTQDWQEDPGCQVAYTLVDGGYIRAVVSYPLTNVTANHTGASLCHWNLLEHASLVIVRHPAVKRRVYGEAAIALTWGKTEGVVTDLGSDKNNEVTLNLPQFDGHFKKKYTMNQRGENLGDVGSKTTCKIYIKTLSHWGQVIGGRVLQSHIS
jgi:hypothetical protein